MKIKVWMIFLLGLGIVLLASQFIEDQVLAGSVIGEYILLGGISLIVYHVSHKFWKRKQKSKSLV